MVLATARRLNVAATALSCLAIAFLFVRALGILLEYTCGIKKQTGVPWRISGYKLYAVPHAASLKEVYSEAGSGHSDYVVQDLNIGSMKYVFLFGKSVLALILSRIRQEYASPGSSLCYFLTFALAVSLRLWRCADGSSSSTSSSATCSM